MPHRTSPVEKNKGFSTGEVRFCICCLNLSIGWSRMHLRLQKNADLCAQPSFFPVGINSNCDTCLWESSSNIFSSIFRPKARQERTNRSNVVFLTPTTPTIPKSENLSETDMETSIYVSSSICACNCSTVYLFPFVHLLARCVSSAIRLNSTVKAGCMLIRISSEAMYASKERLSDFNFSLCPLVLYVWWRRVTLSMSIRLGRLKQDSCAYTEYRSYFIV